jgi:hypothetical protein
VIQETQVAGKPLDIVHDIFVSYSKKDRLRLEPFLDAFRRERLRFWIDEDIRPGHRWSEPLTAALKASRYVVVFLTEESTKSDHVQQEIKLGSDRLVPVLLHDAPNPLPYDFGAFCDRFQQYHIDSSHSAAQHPAFVRLCRHLAEIKSEQAATAPDVVLTSAQEIERWLAREPSVEDLAMAIAVAVLENETLDNARAAALELTSRLKAIGNDGASTTTTEAEARTTLRSRLLQSRSKMLGAINAEEYKVVHPQAGVEVTCCRFGRADYGRALLAHIWRELDEVRHPLIEWLEWLARFNSIDVKLRLGYALGILAQGEFLSVVDALIEPWALDEDVELRQAADIILSVAAHVPNLQPAIRALLDRWASGQATRAELRAALEFLTGYTGARFPDWAFPTLRTAANTASDRRWVWPILENAMGRLVRRASGAGDTSLWNVDSMLANLAIWAEAPKRDEIIELPMFLFLCLLADIPLFTSFRIRRGISLQALLMRSQARDGFVRLLGRALSGYRFQGRAASTRSGQTAAGAAPSGEKSSPAEAPPVASPAAGAAPPAAAQPERDPTAEKWFREEAIGRLRAWLADPRRKEIDVDPVLELARLLFRSASNDRDRERLLYIFRHEYDRARLEAEPRLLDGEAA